MIQGLSVLSFFGWFLFFTCLLLLFCREPLTGDTAVMAAILRKNFALAKLLIKDFHSQPNCVNNSMQGALHFAVASDDADTILFLVKLGVDTLQKVCFHVFLFFSFL